MRALIAIAYLLAASPSFAEENDFTIRAGLIERTADDHLRVYYETTNIPFIPKTADPEFFSGVIASTSREGRFKCHMIARVPKPDEIRIDPRDVDPVESLHVKLDSSAGEFVTLASKHRICANAFSVLLRLDESDLPGIYSVEVFINDTPRRRFDFKVRGPHDPDERLGAP